MINVLNSNINGKDSAIFTILKNDIIQLPTLIIADISKNNEKDNSAIFTLMKTVMKLPKQLLKIYKNLKDTGSGNEKDYSAISRIKKNVLIPLSKPLLKTISEDNKEYAFFKRILCAFIVLIIHCILASIMLGL